MYMCVTLRSFYGTSELLSWAVIKNSYRRYLLAHVV